MENTENFGDNRNKLNELLNNENFIDFISHKEDKWLQNIGIESKLNVIFGSVERAISDFGNDKIFNSINHE